MNLPWDRNWFKLCFYIIITFTAVYIIKEVIDMCAYTLINVKGVTEGIFKCIRYIIAVLAPIITAFVIYYVLSPLVDMIKERVKSRRLACIIVFGFLCFFPVCIGAVSFFKLRSLGQGSVTEGIFHAFTYLIKRMDTAYMSLTYFLENMGLGIIRDYIEGAVFRADLRSYSDILRLCVVSCLNLILGGVMGFYLLLREKPFGRLSDILAVLLPRKIYKPLKTLGEDLNHIFLGYIRGQLTDGLIMSLLIGTGLWLVKIPFAFAIGIISGFSNLIPYFGSAVGFVLTIASALISGEYIRVLYGCGIMLLLQQLDSVYIVPKVVGEKVKISPFGVIAALSIGGKVFGLWGMVLAVPVTAVLKAYILRVYSRKKLSLTQKN